MSLTKLWKTIWTKQQLFIVFSAFLLYDIYNICLQVGRLYLKMILFAWAIPYEVCIVQLPTFFMVNCLERSENSAKLSSEVNYLTDIPLALIIMYLICVPSWKMRRKTLFEKIELDSNTQRRCNNEYFWKKKLCQYL